MRIAMVGLGRMGANMASRLMANGHELVAFDVNEDAGNKARSNGASVIANLEELTFVLERPRVVWIMVPAGNITESTIQALAKILEPGDVIVDGGNSNYRQSMQRAKELDEKEIHFIDAGVSGGVWGLENGYCLMVGGTPEAVSIVSPAFTSLAPTDGYAHVGASGSGHFVKMVHNGIEYGLMQSYAEGFELLNSATEFQLDLKDISELWQHGSVVQSWLLELTHRALADDENFSTISDWVEDSGEGRWTIQEALDRAVPLPAITAALFARFASRQDESFASKLSAALRQQFGGHSVIS